MDRKVKMKKGVFYRNDVWFSPAYQKLTLSARDLLQCLWSEIRKVRVGKIYEERRNGKLSFTEVDYKKLTNRTSATYLSARNLLIEVGFIEVTHRGGSCRGDRSMYKVLFGITDMPRDKEKWRNYPKQNWKDLIPKAKNTLIGKKTRFKKGQSGKKAFSHPSE